MLCTVYVGSTPYSESGNTEGAVRGLLRLIFSGEGGGRDAACQPLPVPMDTDVDRCEPVETDAHRVGTPCPFPTRRWADPAEHAAAILEFLQGPGGRTGSIPVEELQQLHIPPKPPSKKPLGFLG